MAASMSRFSKMTEISWQIYRLWAMECDEDERTDSVALISASSTGRYLAGGAEKHCPKARPADGRNTTTSCTSLVKARR